MWASVLLVFSLYCPLSLRDLMNQAAMLQRLTWQRMEGGLVTAFKKLRPLVQ
jgi:hypothetical protein